MVLLIHRNLGNLKNCAHIDYLSHSVLSIYSAMEAQPGRQPRVSLTRLTEQELQQYQSTGKCNVK